MILDTLAIASALLVVASGLIILALGQWQPHKLKFAAICISTTAAIWLTIKIILCDGLLFCDINTISCLTSKIYNIAHNCVFVLFHIAIGRDAIRFKMCDRRRNVR